MKKHLNVLIVCAIIFTVIVTVKAFTKKIEYRVVDKYSLEVAATFSNMSAATSYINYYKDSHDYIIEER